MTTAQQSPPFHNFWDESLRNKFWFVLKQWHKAFDTTDDAQLIQRNIDRECLRADINQDVWFDFFRELISLGRPIDPFEAVISILFGPNKKRFTLAGSNISWHGDVCHYERLDRLNEYSLRFPIGNGDILENIAQAIENGLCTGAALEGRSFSRTGRPVWITDVALTTTDESDVVRNRLGLRSVNQSGYRLIEIRYRVAYLHQNDVRIKAPTVLDAWCDGPGHNWIFTKRPEAATEPKPGRTIDVSDGGAGAAGVIEAVHETFLVGADAGRHLQLRVLLPTTGPPPEMSLYALLKNTLL